MIYCDTDRQGGMCGKKPGGGEAPRREPGCGEQKAQDLGSPRPGSGLGGTFTEDRQRERAEVRVQGCYFCYLKGHCFSESRCFLGRARPDLVLLSGA